MDISKVLEWIRLSTKHLLAVALATGFLLFAPRGWLEKIHIKNFTDEFSIWIGILFSGSLALLFSESLGQR